MNFLKKWFGGGGGDDEGDSKALDGTARKGNVRDRNNVQNSEMGFGERRDQKSSTAHGPILRDTTKMESKASYTQGLDWYRDRLRVDEDGDIACDFLEENCGKSTDEPRASKYPRKDVLQSISTRTLPASVSLKVKEGFVDNELSRDEGH